MRASYPICDIYDFFKNVPEDLKSDKKSTSICFFIFLIQIFKIRNFNFDAGG